LPSNRPSNTRSITFRIKGRTHTQKQFPAECWQTAAKVIPQKKLLAKYWQTAAKDSPQKKVPCKMLADQTHKPDSTFLRGVGGMSEATE